VGIKKGRIGKTKWSPVNTQRLKHGRLKGKEINQKREREQIGDISTQATHVSRSPPGKKRDGGKLQDLPLLRDLLDHGGGKDGR